MNEENEEFGERLAESAKEATREAFLKARELMGDEGILIVENNQLMRLFSDDSFTVLRKIV
jgi:hypothetical protein